MTTINQLPTMTLVTAPDQIPVFSSQNGDARKAAMSVVRDYIVSDLQNGFSVTLTASSYLKATSMLVANLPAAATAGAGAHATVTNATQTLTAGIGAVVAGGGANVVPVFSDGTNWRIG